MPVGKSFLDALGIAAASDESSRQKLIKSLQESAAVDQTEDSTMIHHSSMTKTFLDCLDNLYYAFVSH